MWCCLVKRHYLNKRIQYAFNHFFVNRFLCIDGHDAVLVRCVYSGQLVFCVRPGGSESFWQMFVILEIMNLIDRFLIDGYWVGHTNAWVIPGTEDLQPYITTADKIKKWVFGTVGMAIIAAVLSGFLWH